MNGVIRRMASRQHKLRKLSISPNSRLEALKLYLSHYCVKSVRTSSMVTCGRPPTTISRMLPACTGNCRSQCCGINPSEQPGLGASSQPRLRKAIVERDCARLNNAFGAVRAVRVLGGCRCYACGSGADRNRATASGRRHRLQAQCRQHWRHWLQSRRGYWFVKDVLETAWPLSIAENGTGLHRTARRTRPSTHRLAAAVDAADARVALPCHIALDQRPRTRGHLWNTHPAVARSV